MNLFFKKLGWLGQGFAIAMIAMFIGCARPANAQDYCYAGLSAGVSYAYDQYTRKMESRIFEILSTSDVNLKFKEKKFGFPYEMFTGCRKGNFAIELGKIENITASVKTTASFRFQNQTFSGDVNRLAEVSGFSLSLLAYQRLGSRLEIYERVGIVHASGMITAALPLPHEYDGGVIAYRRKAWLPYAGIGIQGKVGDHTDWRLEVKAIGAPVPIGMFGLSQRF